MMSCSAASSVRTCPVTLARMVRAHHAPPGAIALQQVEHGEVRGGLPIGDGGAFQDQPGA